MRSQLSAEDENAILELPHVIRSFRASTYLVREGEPPNTHCSFIESGFTFRHKLTAAGSRQILSVQLPGDFVDLEHIFLEVADHDVQALTDLELICIDRLALRRLVLERPAVGQAMWIDALVDGSIFREWVTNVGRRDARARIAHLICEIALRMTAAGIATKDRFEFPLTQEQLADAVGLTQVHVNRTLKSLEIDGVVYRDRRYMTVTDWDKITAIGDFNALYLHLGQARQ